MTIIGDAAAYRSYQRTRSSARSASGYYDADRREIVLLHDPHFRSTAAHELSHAALRRRLPNPPPWLNEGLAEYFGQSLLTGASFVSGLVPPDRLGEL